MRFIDKLIKADNIQKFISQNGQLEINELSHKTKNSNRTKDEHVVMGITEEAIEMNLITGDDELSYSLSFEKYIDDRIILFIHNYLVSKNYTEYYH